MLQQGENDPHPGLDGLPRIFVVLENLQISVERASGDEIFHKANAGRQVLDQMIQRVSILLDGFRPIVAVQL